MENERSTPLARLVFILLLGFGLRVIYLTVDRFHADEALYAGWALLIPDGDPLLLSVPVDKPPLYLYALAGSMRLFGASEAAARVPSLAASMLGIALVYRLGKRLYNGRTGLWAAIFVALSPYDILFARTAFTDPMLVLWTLAALCTAAEGRWFWAGFCLGLAFATKQQAVLLIPLVAAVGSVQERKAWPALKAMVLSGLPGFALPLALVVAWDSARWAVRPGYWEQSAMSYGGLAWAAFAEWRQRLGEWLAWARDLTGSLALNLILFLGSSALLIQDWRRRPKERQTWLDTLFAAYTIGYLALHTALAFSVWDRYLLPLVIPVGLIMGRIVTQGHSWLASQHSDGARLAATTKVGTMGHQNRQGERWGGLALAVAVCLIALFCGWKAAHNGYPIGGEHWAYQGVDEVAAYLRKNAPADAVLYHHWLRWHYTYYLYGTHFELRWWQSGEHLRREAMRSPERAQYIVLPDWHTLDPEAEGIRLRPVYEARQPDGRVSMRVYQIEVEPDEMVPTREPTYE